MESPTLALCAEAIPDALQMASAALMRITCRRLFISVPPRVRRSDRGGRGHGQRWFCNVRFANTKDTPRSADLIAQYGGLLPILAPCPCRRRAGRSGLVCAG